MKMFGLTLSPGWGAVLAVVVLGALLAVTHVINIRVG